MCHWLGRCAGLSVLALALCSCSSPEASPSIVWQNYDPAVLDWARQEERPVILEFSADWCPPCKELDQFTFSDQRVIDAAAPFVMVKADVTDWESPESEALKSQFGVTGVPEILFFDAEGNEIPEIRAIGFLAADYFLRRMNLVSAPGK